jgi:GAF domain-containing protein
MSKYDQIAEFTKNLIEEKDRSNVIELFAIEAKRLLQSERCSIFLIDSEADMLWTKHSDGIGRIVISVDSGIVGYTYKTKTPQIVNNPYENENFMPSIDKKSGFTTNNIITTLIYGSNHEVIGILQLLNKSEGDFNQQDLELLNFFANYVSGVIELALMDENNISF